MRLAEQHRRPCLVVDLDEQADAQQVRRWLAEHRVETLNVAGPRESLSPGIGAQAAEFLEEVLSV
jgi:hypothetical protein